MVWVVGAAGSVCVLGAVDTGDMFSCILGTPDGPGSRILVGGGARGCEGAAVGTYVGFDTGVARGVVGMDEGRKEEVMPASAMYSTAVCLPIIVAVCIAFVMNGRYFRGRPSGSVRGSDASVTRRASFGVAQAKRPARNLSISCEYEYDAT